MMDNGLNRVMIQQGLKTDAFGREVYAFGKIDSTNRIAKDLAKAGKPEGTLIYAEEQTHGQGRWGKSWYSPWGKGLWFSLILRPKVNSSISQLNGMGVLSLAQLIEKKFDFMPQIKEPNDLLFKNKKLAGVLVETSRSQRSISHVVLGIGLNVNQKRRDFIPSLRNQAISLQMVTNQVVDRLTLLSDLLVQLEKNYFLLINQKVDFTVHPFNLSGCHPIKNEVGVHHAAGR
ncbi:biotin--[acetyl-CoA-carboxylase] ligase [bacterium]|nr:biotin--[acetyl-CoA-carboxylase] ligase [bacterium]